MVKNISKKALKSLSIARLKAMQSGLAYLDRSIEALVDEKHRASYDAVLASKWKVSGKPSEHDFKAALIREVGSKHNIRCFIETGSFKGEMIRKQLPVFDKIYSIEFLPEFYYPLKEAYQGNDSVEILQGNSGDVLQSLLAHIQEPCLFWLDAHFQVGTPAGASIDAPVRAEIEAIVQHPLKHVVLIDDARYFNGSMHYPTIDEIASKFKQRDERYQVSVQGDVIVIE